MGWFDFGRSSTLFWPGCFSSAKLSSVVSNYRKVLKRLGIDYSMPDSDFACCGGILIEAGYDKQSRKIARENFELFKKKGIKKIITSCPLCYNTFSKDYPAFLPDWDIEVEFILSEILNKIKNYPGYVRSPAATNAVYYDSCVLGRYCGIYEEPREILSLLGYYLTESKYSKQDSLCCGSCSNLPEINPELAGKIAKDFLNHFGASNTHWIITADPQAYVHLKNHLSDRPIKIKEMSEALCEALDLN